MKNWMIDEEHEHYGKVVMMRSLEGEAYRWFLKDGSISMIPLSILQEEDVI